MSLIRESRAKPRFCQLTSQYWHSDRCLRGMELAKHTSHRHDCCVVIFDSGWRAWIYQETATRTPGPPRMHAAAPGRPRSTWLGSSSARSHRANLGFHRTPTMEIPPSGYCKRAPFSSCQQRHGKRDIRHKWTACVGVLRWPHHRTARAYARTARRGASSC